MLPQMMTDFSVEKEHLRNFKRWKAEYHDGLDVGIKKMKLSWIKIFQVGLEGMGGTTAEMEDLKIHRTPITKLSVIFCWQQSINVTKILFYILFL